MVFYPLDSSSNPLKFQTNSLNETFSVAQFHFHWGENDYQGSEHYIDDIKYPAEVKADNRALYLQKIAF